jgi:hypothetical protein
MTAHDDGLSLRTFLSHPSADDRRNHREVSMIMNSGETNEFEARYNARVAKIRKRPLSR